VHGTSFAPCVVSILTHLLYFRCTARSKDLDGDGFRRSQEWTELLVDSFPRGVIWDDYGIVADVIVSALQFISDSNV
jgi:hypothetical protein